MAQIKKRTQKVSKGLNKGARKTHLTELQKVLLVNGGSYHRFRNRSFKR